MNKLQIGENTHYHAVFCQPVLPDNHIVLLVVTVQCVTSQKKLLRKIEFNQFGL